MSSKYRSMLTQSIEADKASDDFESCEEKRVGKAVSSAVVRSQAEPESEAGYHTRALVRALSILDLFSSERRPLGVKDLHQLLALPKPTVSRLSSVLERFGYLTRRGGTYVLGPKLFELGSLFARQDGLVEISRLPLEEATADTRQTSCLGVLKGPDIVHVVVVPSVSPVHYVTNVGSLAPAHSTGLGKALLAQLSSDAFEFQMSQLVLKRYTPNTIVDAQRLRKEISTIRRRGYAIDDEETAIGLKCVAMAVSLAPMGAVAISFSGPAADFTDQRIAQYVHRLGQTASQLCAAFSAAADVRSSTNHDPGGGERSRRRKARAVRQPSGT
jgi:IclR family transcriptional regulator, acetate operon repressor